MIWFFYVKSEIKNILDVIFLGDMSPVLSSTSEWLIGALQSWPAVYTGMNRQKSRTARIPSF